MSLRYKHRKRQIAAQIKAREHYDESSEKADKMLKDLTHMIETDTLPPETKAWMAEMARVNALHAEQAHPDYDYTTSQLFAVTECLETDGWERNHAIKGCNDYAQRDYTTFWRRRKTPSP